MCSPVQLDWVYGVWIACDTCTKKTLVLFRKEGNLPGPRLPILAKVGITGPQWHPTTLMRITLNEKFAKSLIFVISERPGLKEVDVIKKLHKRYLNLMAQTILANHVTEGGNILKKIFMAVPQLHSINEHQNKVIGSFRIDRLPCYDDDEPSDDVQS
jgi:hypothetical protein